MAKQRIALASIDTFATPKTAPIKEKSDDNKLNLNVNDDVNVQGNVNVNVSDNVNVKEGQTRSISEIDREYTEIKKKKGIEDTHTRQTFLIRNDLAKRLDRLAKARGKGWKTKVANMLIEKMLDELEGRSE